MAGPTTNKPAVVILTPRDKKPLHAGRVRGDISQYTGVTSDVRDVKMLPSGIILVLCATAMCITKAMKIACIDGTPCTTRLSKRPYTNSPPRRKQKMTRTTTKGVIYRIPLNTSLTSLNKINNVKTASRMHNKDKQPTTSILLEFHSNTLPKEIKFNKITYPVTKFNVPRKQQKPTTKHTKPKYSQCSTTQITYNKTTTNRLYSAVVQNNTPQNNTNKHTNTTTTINSQITPTQHGVLVTTELLGNIVLLARDQTLTDRQALQKVRALINKQNGFPAPQVTPINKLTQTTPTQTSPTQPKPTQSTPTTSPTLFLTQTTPQTLITTTQTKNTPTQQTIHLLDSSGELDDSFLSKPPTPRSPTGLGRRRTQTNNKTTPKNKQTTPTRPNTRSRAKHTANQPRPGNSKRQLY
ncbi:mucin-2-like [Ylistrum balloti]|uniref:mucin-2-like n=2 Tax=Ylistrum balloti TaxID=509963 RepID=UPI002905AC7D|nr:mucin-2-like [Ylistrum balloti]XP_060085007.1 mucin-2-like [Ylistrum balloti]XP_060085012.1 mucin-2-like [Ylistrum balloti]